MNRVSSEKVAFAAALSCATPAEREACLEEHCGADTALRGRVEALLLAADEAGDFLENPPAALTGDSGALLEREGLSEKRGDRIGRYRLLEKIGEGGCGVVYMAEQDEPVRRRVALKVIKPGMDTRAVVARFEAERQALALMDHACIARVLDGGATPGGRPYFVMELVRGTPITAFCDEARLSTAARLQLFMQVCLAVQHAHQKGIIHRDLKPSNILVTVNDGAPVPKVIDFGIAKAAGQRLTDKSIFTQFHAFIGTPAYISPEQAEMSSVDVDTRSDIYSLGVLLYELLTSRTPFDGTELMRAGLDEMRRVIRNEDPPLPSSRLTGLGAEEATALSAKRKASVPELAGAARGDLDWIVMKCLEKDRGRRYQTAGGLAADVRRHLDHVPITARPPHPLYLLRKLVLRHKGTFAALAVIVGVLCAGVIVSVSQAMRALRGEARANAALAELQASAPVFAEQARGLAAAGQLAEAVGKLDYALKLAPGEPRYLVGKATLLECQLRFAEAAEVFRALCALNPADTRSQTHLSLCGRPALPPGPAPSDWHETLSRLYNAMVTERDVPSEPDTVSYAKVGEMAGKILDHLKEGLRMSDSAAARPVSDCLSVSQGYLSLDLDRFPITDLGPIRGFPLSQVDMSGGAVTDIRPLSESPVRSLNLSGSRVSDLSPLREMSTLRNLCMVQSAVTSLAPIAGLPLEWLALGDSPVADLEPLRGMPLSVLRIGGTPVSDLSPLAGMPFEEFDCRAVPATDFSPLASCLKLTYLDISATSLASLEVFRKHQLRSIVLDGTRVTDLSPLAGMPLHSLTLMDTPVTDVRPLAQCPTLAEVILPRGVKNVEVLRGLPNLRRISFQRGKTFRADRTAAEFWKDLENGKLEP